MGGSTPPPPGRSPVGEVTQEQIVPLCTGYRNGDFQRKWRCFPPAPRGQLQRRVSLWATAKHLPLVARSTWSVDHCHHGTSSVTPALAHARAPSRREWPSRCALDPKTLAEHPPPSAPPRLLPHAARQGMTRQKEKKTGSTRTAHPPPCLHSPRGRSPLASSLPPTPAPCLPLTPPASNRSHHAHPPPPPPSDRIWQPPHGRPWQRRSFHVPPGGGRGGTAGALAGGVAGGRASGASATLGGRGAAYWACRRSFLIRPRPPHRPAPPPSSPPLISLTGCLSAWLLLSSPHPSPKPVPRPSSRRLPD